MSLNGTFSVFSDETYPAAGGLAFGALVTPTSDTAILRAEIRRLRRRHLVGWEVKGAKGWRKTLAFREDLCRAFFQHPSARFFLGRVEDWPERRHADGNVSEAFFCAYGEFLAQVVRPRAVYWMYPDGFPGSAGHGWDIVRSAIEERHGGQARVACLAPWRSFKGSDLLQLTDVLLGALTSQSQTEAKARVRELVDALRATVTHNGALKISAGTVGQNCSF